MVALSYYYEVPQTETPISVIRAQIDFSMKKKKEKMLKKQCRNGHFDVFCLNRITRISEK